MSKTDIILIGALGAVAFYAVNKFSNVGTEVVDNTINTIEKGWETIFEAFGAEKGKTIYVSDKTGLPVPLDDFGQPQDRIDWSLMTRQEAERLGVVQQWQNYQTYGTIFVPEVMTQTRDTSGSFKDFLTSGHNQNLTVMPSEVKNPFEANTFQLKPKDDNFKSPLRLEREAKEQAFFNDGAKALIQRTRLNIFPEVERTFNIAQERYNNRKAEGRDPFRDNRFKRYYNDFKDAKGRIERVIRELEEDWKTKTYPSDFNYYLSLDFKR